MKKPITYAHWVDGEIVEQRVYAPDADLPDPPWYRVEVRLGDYDASRYRETARVDTLEDGLIVRRPVLEEIALEIPSVVSPYQARVALLNAGLLDAVETLMANPGTPAAARIAWEYATVIQRHSPFINTLGPALGLSETQIDDLFRVAATIE